jgi:cellobiose phosphorylase
MLHPRDEVTGLSYSLLPMIHGVINDMFTPRQAEHHLAVIREHLSGPDGARLFDKPMAYHGGIQTNFQRAESASFFGREIGIMYTHAHLRWCEALARFGDAEGFFKGLCQFMPILPREAVPSARPRQANCYYSSSDAVFADRYEAFSNYDGVLSGEVPLEGGWRVYSSGAGIGVRLILQGFVGERLEAQSLIMDPGVPKELDGLKVGLVIEGRKIEILYQIEERGCGPVSVNLNGEDLDFIREANPYRTGGVRIALDRFKRGLVEELNRLTVWLG